MLVPWPLLLEAQRDYVRWRAYVLWVRCIEQTEGTFPYWLGEKVDRHAPRFLRDAADYAFNHRKAPYPKTCWQMLQQWVCEHVFAKPWKEGWMDAVGLYATRHLAALRDNAYCTWCLEHWSRNRPLSYPSFREWRTASQQFSDEDLNEVEMRDDRRELIKLSRRVRPRTLDLATDRRAGWEVFVGWARVALEELCPLPKVVDRELRDRCPGFLELHGRTKTGPPIVEALGCWIDEHPFRAANQQGWSAVLRYQTALHPRCIRAADFRRNSVRQRSETSHAKYPPLDVWSRAVDACMFEARHTTRKGR